MGFWDGVQEPWLLLDFPMAYFKTTTALQMFPQDRVMAKAFATTANTAARAARSALTWALVMALVPQLSLIPGR